MLIKNNVLKQYLKNVYFLSGTACGGKSTAAKVLAEKYGYILYDVDAEFDKHALISDSINQPAMNKQFANADDFFLRPVDEYIKWLKENTRQQLDYVILDLIRLSQNNIVIFDGHLSVEEADMLTDKSRVAFLVKKPGRIIDDYCGRVGHEGFTAFINSAKDVNAAKENCNTVLEKLNGEKYKKIAESEYFYIVRDKDSTVEKTTAALEKHFGWNKSL